MTKTVHTSKGLIPVRKYSFGWAVARGAYESVGSYRTLAALVAAIDAA